MATYQLRCEMLVPLGIEEVFSVFENPYNLIKITPPWLDFRVTNGEPVTMRMGAEIHYTLKMKGIPMKWTTHITEYAPPFRFVDQQFKGPYSLWRHLHTFEETPDGVLVKDAVDYILPMGPIGRIAQPIVKRDLLEIFSYRQKALAEMWGGARLTAPAITLL